MLQGSASRRIVYSNSDRQQHRHEPISYPLRTSSKPVQPEGPPRCPRLSQQSQLRESDDEDEDDSDEEEDDYEDEDEDQSEHLSEGADEADDIIRDPFFQKLENDIQDIGVDEEEESDETDSDDTDTEGLASPVSPRYRDYRQDSITDPLFSPGLPPGLSSPRAAQQAQDRHDSAAMQEINIAVVGARGVGKTRFIQNAFGLSTKPPSVATQRSMYLEKVVYNVRLVEILLEDLELDDDENSICWPDSAGGAYIPRIDGVFLLYDAQNQDSMDCQELLSGSSLPCLLVSCDSPHPEFEKKAKGLVPDLTIMRTTRSISETQQHCFTVLLRSIISKQTQAKFAAARRRANTSAVRQTLERIPHARANSEYSISNTRLSGSTLSSGYGHPAAAHQSFLNMDDPRDPRSRHSSSTDTDVEYGTAISPISPEEPSIPEKPVPEHGCTFDQLVDKLLSQPLSKTDSKFVSIFLALYRAFARPMQLLEAILVRFDMLRGTNQPQLMITQQQQRILSVLDQWVSMYPGDFAHKATRQRLQSFVASLQSISILSVAAKEIGSHLEVPVNDDDGDWGRSDFQDSKAKETDLELKKTNTQTTNGSSEEKGTSSTRNSRTATGSISLSPSQTLIHIIENAATQARTLVPSPRIPLTKVQWHSFMECLDDSITKELTYMDWIMFSSIRPRDLIRHVSLSAAQKQNTKSLENVNRAIEHFNHLAYWVANFILLRDKPKHRALMMEKFMRIARKLRELNNYNSLGAILAGLQSTPIHRLLSTRDLINPTLQKDYLKLEILMGTAKSHFAYRLAWENSSNERIPYIPLHLRDLVSASLGNKTFFADTGEPDGPERINWKKFEIMGEVVVGIQKAQEVPYPKLDRDDEVRNLVLDCRLSKDDDELYDRSTAVEPAGGAGDRRRFNWFQRSSSQV